MSQPLYEIVLQAVVERIANGTLAPGAMLPSEAELGKGLGVSQGTARKALSILEQRGVLQRRQGRGTFVTAQTPESALFHFFRLRSLDGGADAPKLEEQTVLRRAAEPSETRILADAPDDVFEIRRVRSIAGQRVVHEIAVVPAALFPGLADRTPLPNTLYVLFQQAYGCVIIRADERIRAVAASETVADALGVDVGSPVLEVERRAFDILGRVVERRRSACLTEAHCYAVSLA